MKQIIITLAIVFVAFSLQAQNAKEEYIKNKNKEKRQYADSLKQSYDEFRRQANEQYAQFMRERWESFQAVKGDPKPELPEPLQPFKFDGDKPIPELPNPIPYKPIPTPAPDPIQPIKRPDVPQPSQVPNMNKFTFTCFGTPCEVQLDNSLRFKLKDISENSVADAWLELSTEYIDLLLADCLDLREEMVLGDWGYYCLLHDLTNAFLGKGTDEATLMQVYLLAQSGYKVRIGHKNGHIVTLLAFDGTVYEQSGVRIEGERFCIIGNNESGKIHLFNRKFSDNERVMSLRMTSPPKFAFIPNKSRTYTSRRYPDMIVTFSTNKNLTDFYNGYPYCDWTYYAWAGLSDDVKEKLYPMLRKSIEGESQIGAANRIINFVQTAFEYKTDQNQFGCERPLFGDETFFYPYSDCEDRAILFSILIRDLLGLDVVLLHYTDHLATAVHYTEKLGGDCFEFEGKTYYVSDPTYMDAFVGFCMPQYKNATPVVYKL